MAKALYALGLVLAYLGAVLLESPGATVDAFEVVFSDEIVDLKIGASGMLRDDWPKMLLGAPCALAAKVSTPHVIETPIRGTFYTTFEYLTSDCTAEYKRDNGTCIGVTNGIGVCANFYLDIRTNQRPWGYCSNFNFRYSYMWAPNVTTMTIMPPQGTLVPSPGSPIGSQRASSLDWDTSATCSGFGCNGTTSRIDTGIALIRKDTLTLSRLVVREATLETYAILGGRNETACNWRFSNLVPVAWDGTQNVLASGQALQSSDTEYALVMQYDCNLVLYKKGTDGRYVWNGKWAAFSQFNDPFKHNCTLELQPNGNLVVRDGLGGQRWTSNRTASTLYTSALSVLRSGKVGVYEMVTGAVVWEVISG